LERNGRPGGHILRLIGPGDNESRSRGAQNVE